ncbi:putative trans-sialidase, Group II [Trypanosoma cruzi]|uniref:Putative trans-sialidase, Group II n=1 Tax=Trypanosoma cruzi TaxID=5693 RepID=A0A2V2VR69_TRYCR|nr:putative trans-sialidase, Group II [Trypanosoma cruzi]
MLSRVAAVKAPNKHSCRGVTGSSGRRRKGRESEHRRPNMSRHVFASAVLLLVMMMCCGTCGAAAAGGNNGKSGLRNFRKLQRVDLFVPRTTLVLPKEGTAAGTPRDSFVTPSLVSAGGVIAAFAEGHAKAQNTAYVQLDGPSFSDVVAGYIDSKWNWSTLVAQINKSTWRAHTVLTATEAKEQSLVSVHQPTTIAKGNKVFLLSESFLWSYSYGKFYCDGLDLKLVVGTVTNSTGGEPSKRIEWGAPKLLLSVNISATSYESKFERFFPSGGSGVLMNNGTLVFPVVAFDDNDDYSMIIYSTDDGANWMLSNGTSPAKCSNSRVTEWEGSLLMIVDCEDGQRVYESRDMGTTWTGTIGTLPGVWTKSKSAAILDRSFYVEALITATIEEKKVILYTQKGYASGGEAERALYLWVTDNNRSFCVGPVAMRDDMNWLFTSNLLHSDGNLHLLQQRENDKGSALSLSRLTGELSTTKSVLSTWAKKDAFFSSFSIPTAGLVAVLSDTASNGTWIDEYLCLNATVTPNAKKVRYGFQLTEPSSRVSWSVNTRVNNVRHVSLSHNFTLVALVTIEETPSGNTPLLTATLADTNSNHTMGLSYTADKTWGTGLKGKTTKQSGRWEPKKGYQVALMLQGKKASVYIDGQSLGEEELPLKGEAPLELVRFCFGACGEDAGQKTKVTVKNVFLYNRPLNPTEMRAIKDKAHTLNGPGESLAGWAALEGAAARDHAAVVSLTSAGSGLLPLLLLLGLWGFAAA